MKTVMVVDDAMFMRSAIKSMLEKNGYQVIGEAANGKEAIQKYGQLKPDLVTMDITMPEMDGINAVKGIKAVDPKAVIIMISALGQENMVRDAIVAGAKSFLIKPFDEVALVKTISSL